MLLLVNKYGLSHVCALEEFQNLGIPSDRLPYNFPNLDILFPLGLRSSPSDSCFDSCFNSAAIEFFYRGVHDRQLEFNNLFEYLLWTASNG